MIRFNFKIIVGFRIREIRHRIKFRNKFRIKFRNSNTE